jgi:hypothetical protein
MKPMTVAGVDLGPLHATADRQKNVAAVTGAGSRGGGRRNGAPRQPRPSEQGAAPETDI